MNHILDMLHREPKTRDDVCSKHGPFTAKCFLGDIWTSCPDCVDEEHQREASAAKAKELEDNKQRWISKMGAACIPERFKDRTLKSYVATTEPQKIALQAATDYANNFSEALKTGRSLVFIGKPGTGKTHLAVGIALRIMHRENRVVYFTTVRKAINRVKATWTKGSTESEIEAIQSLAMPDLLILDEVGVQFGSDAEKMILFDIINERYEQRRPTLLMSNLSAEGVSEYLGQRIVDRLKEDDGRFIVFNWESYRGKECT